MISLINQTYLNTTNIGARFQVPLFKTRGLTSNALWVTRLTASGTFEATLIPRAIWRCQEINLKTEKIARFMIVFSHFSWLTLKNRCTEPHRVVAFFGEHSISAREGGDQRERREFLQKALRRVGL